MQDTLARVPWLRPLMELGLSGGFYAVLGLWVILLALALSLPACSPASVQARLQNGAEAALRAGEFGFADVRMRGQIAELEGYAASRAEVQEAAAAVLRSAGPGGPWRGGITHVRTRSVVVLPPVSPFTWRAERAEGQITVRGVAPSERQNQRVLRALAQKFPDLKVNPQIKVASGAPAGPPWADIALLAVDQLTRLERGAVQITDTALTVTGEAKAAEGDAIRAALRGRLPRPYTFDVDVLGPGEELAIPELQGLSLRDAGPTDCQTAFNRVLGDRTIGFEAASAELSPGAAPLISALARVARRCDRFEIEVSGHTSSEGDRAQNLDLSRERAQAVVRALTQRGVAEERITAIGYGPDLPRADNATPEGRAANRRIEFKVAE